MTVEDAKLYAARLLSARPYSAAALTSKLLGRGFTEDDAAGAVASLVSGGYLDDQSYARTVAKHYTGRGYGRRRVEAELHRRGIDRETAREAAEELPEPDDTLDALVSEMFKNGPPDERALRRFTERLRRRGFDWPDIRDALSREREGPLWSDAE
ncbi:MAG: recombination regulator RecX [Oscillospiraceae bacterium]|nr:recombination regulator RecX [Oscillospiraceae bacterium]